MLAVVGLLSVVYHALFDLTPIVSNSMAPTLRGDGAAGSDWLLAEKLSYRLRRPARWEIIQFRNKDGNWVAKRVVGLPGETIAMRERDILINGQVVAPPKSLGFLRYYAFGSLSNGRSVDCKEGYFVLGDDSRDSFDSRYEGVVRPDEVQGRAWLIVRPLSRFGFVTP